MHYVLQVKLKGVKAGVKAGCRIFAAWSNLEDSTSLFRAVFLKKCLSCLALGGPQTVQGPPESAQPKQSWNYLHTPELL